MERDEVEWVRDAFADGRATRLRLSTGHTIYECGEAAGISGEAWWKFENGASITAHRAAILGAVLQRMRSGEGLTGSGEATVPPPRRTLAAKRTHEERELLEEAERLLTLRSADLAALASTWDLEAVRRARAAALRLVRKRIGELAAEPPQA
jgi:hypothetical protein